MFDFFKSITTNKGTSKRENDTSAKDKLSSTVNKAPVKENLNKTDKEKANISKFTSALTGELNSSEGVLSFQSNTDITGLILGDSGAGNNNPDAGITDKYALVVLGMDGMKSVNLFDSLLPYAKKGQKIVFVINTGKQDEVFEKNLEKFEKLSNVLIIRIKRNIYNLKKLFLCAKITGCQYTVLLTLWDRINPRSFIVNLDSAVNGAPDKKLWIPDYSGFDKIKRSWSVSSLSGAVFDTEYLLSTFAECDDSQCLWLPEVIAQKFGEERIAGFSSEFVFNHNYPKEMIAAEISQIGVSVISLLNQGEYSAETAEQVLSKFRVIVNDVYNEYTLNKTNTFFLTSMTAYILYLCELHGLDMEYWKEVFNQIFDFGINFKTKENQRLFDIFVKQVIKKGTTDLFIIENVGMSDIKNSKFYDLACSRFEKVDYQLKRSNFDYYDFNNMIIRMHARAAVLTIASGSLNRNMLCESDNHLTLWHGLGWMKKTVVKPEKFTVGDIVCSSEYCAPRYKEHFFAHDAIPLGSVQTDKLFDETFRNDTRKAIREKYGLTEKDRVIFFAPTFRIGESHQYYDFGMDVEELAEELAKNNLYLITKKHHVFESILMDKGIDASGVRNSKNGHFIVDEEFDFNQLICSCDAFATDYSSGMYYAFVLDLPVFLYAIDVEEYISGPNGLEIKYPDDVPVPFVGKPSIQEFIKAFHDSVACVDTPEYKQYKSDNVGACDGHVGEKLVKYIEDTYFAPENPDETAVTEADAGSSSDSDA